MAADSARPSPWPTLGKLFLALLAAGVLVAGLMMPAVLGTGLIGKHYASQFENTTCNLQETKPPEPTTLYAKDGTTEIARLFTQDRDPVALRDIPKYLQDALVATEDRRFYSHHGVDLRGLIRSAISTSSGDTQGGSTLTMQYVKQIRYYQAGDDPKKQAAAIAQTLQRKMEDARCALDIEGARHESKRTILDNYLNIAFFGEHAYGIQKAAETYFGVPSAKLTLPQSAMLVGLLRAPSAYDPFDNPEAAKQRRNEVLQNLVNNGRLSQAVADKDKATPISLATTKPPVVRQGCANANSSIPNVAFFCEYAVDWLETQNKISANQLETDGLRIVTTLDPKLQASVQNHLDRAVPASSPMTAVLPAVQPKTGDILAMAASKKYGAKPGETEQPIFSSYATGGGASTWKLFPLLTALQTGFPIDWRLTTDGNSGNYHTKHCVTASDNVHNGDENVSYSDTESLTTAMAKSSNTFFVGLADQGFSCVLQPTIDIMQKLGMKSMDAPSTTPHESWAKVIGEKQRAQQLVLGSVPTSAMELTGAYAAVANGGVYNAPAPILSITDNHGRSVRVRRSKSVEAISTEAAARAVQILTQESKPGGASAGQFTSWYGQGGSDIAGKTGTVAPNNKNNSGIWFVGMSPKIVAASGIIDFDNPYAPNEGLTAVAKGKAYGDYAAKVWLEALGPSLQRQHWDWSTINQPTGDLVPNVTGDSLSEAKRTLRRAGYSYELLGNGSVQCASDVTPFSIAFYGPQTAPQGSTITMCESSGVGQTLPPPPVKHIVVKPKPGHNSGHGSGHGAGSGGSGSGSGTGSGPGHGGGGGGNGHHGGPIHH